MAQADIQKQGKIFLLISVGYDAVFHYIPEWNIIMTLVMACK